MGEKAKVLKKRPDVKEALEEEIDEIFENLKLKTHNIKGVEEKLSVFENAYENVREIFSLFNEENMSNKELRIQLRDSINTLYDIVGIKGITGFPYYKTMKENFEQHKSKLQAFYDDISRKKGDPELDMTSKTEREAIRNIENYMESHPDLTPQEHSNAFIRNLNALRSTLRLQEDKEETITPEYLRQYQLLVSMATGKDGSKTTATKFKNLDKIINQVPYTTIYNYLENKYGQPHKQAEPREEEAKGEPSSNIHTLSEYATSAEGKSGDGIKKRNRSRIY